jgi:hypothetical protein
MLHALEREGKKIRKEPMEIVTFFRTYNVFSSVRFASLSDLDRYKKRLIYLIILMFIIKYLYICIRDLNNHWHSDYSTIDEIEKLEKKEKKNKTCICKSFYCEMIFAFLFKMHLSVRNASKKKENALFLCSVINI